MRKLLAVAALLAAALASMAARAEGDPQAGQSKSGVCAACHGADGNSANPDWPSLAGQHPEYLVSQLVAFKEGTRQNPLMTPQAAGLSRQDMEDLAAYYSSQQLAPKEAEAALVDYGKRLYRGGDTDRNVPACIACHGAAGQGNPLAKFPVIAGQHAAYAAAALRAFASGERRSDPNQIMRNIAANMTEADIVAVSSYVQGLR
jgi:cytochrome c553